MSQTLSGVSPPHRANPFAAGRVHSSYAAWQNGRLIHPLEGGRTPSAQTQRVHERFRAHVLSPDFPCLGGKAAVNHNSYRFGLYAEMCEPSTTAGLAYDLCEYVGERPTLGTQYATFVAAFASPVTRDEREWEELLWSQLQSLHDLDSAHHAWDETVSKDPEDPDFSFSFAGTAFFVVGLHPASSRRARRFELPALAFNAHEQFERLREQNRFERLRAAVRARDYELQGSLNPNLSNFGERSEARQYSGRAVEDHWRCPFHARSVGPRDNTD